MQHVLNKGRREINFQSKEIKIFGVELGDQVSPYLEPGKVVFVANNVTKDKNIDLSGLQKGMYLAKISSENATTTEKIILN